MVTIIDALKMNKFAPNEVE